MACITFCRLYQRKQRQPRKAQLKGEGEGDAVRRQFAGHQGINKDPR